jgi:menaquinol-cytochrome c reductase iron-sulfur subunit
MNEENDVSRRDTLKLAIAAIGSFIDAALGIPAIAYIVGPVIKNNKSTKWIRIGSTTRIETDTPDLFKVTVDQQTGWITGEEEVALYVLTENGRDCLAMSNVCTHLGCHVRWVADQGEFLCPCHNGVYDKHGYVVSGPPPRPLDAFETKIENGELSILLPAKKRSA